MNAFVRIDEWAGKSKLIGVYVITHVKSGKVYVGSTGDLYTRTTTHKRNLKANKHINALLQMAYNEDDKLDFAFIITETREQAFNLEQSLISKHMAANRLFNIAENVHGWVRKSKEMREKVKESQTILINQSDYVINKSKKKKKFSLTRRAPVKYRQKKAFMSAL